MNKNLTQIFICIFTHILINLAYSQTSCTLPNLARTNCSNTTGATMLTASSMNVQITSGVYMLQTTGTMSIPNLSIAGGTLILCGGTFTNLNNINMNSGTLIIAANSTVNHNGSMHISGALHNFGTMTFSSTLSVQSNLADGGIFNHSTGLINANNFEINSRIINNGRINLSGRLDIKGSGRLCMGAGSTINSATIHNDGNNSIISTGGSNCLSYSGTFTGNQPISTSSNTILCQQPGATAPNNNLTGAATFLTGCANCGIPLSTEVPVLSATTNNEDVAIQWAIQPLSKQFKYELQISGPEIDFQTIDEIAFEDSYTLKSTQIRKVEGGQYYMRVIRKDQNLAPHILVTEQFYLKPTNKITVYPNPSIEGNPIHITLSKNATEIQSYFIYNSVSQLVAEGSFDTNSILKLPAIERGSYILKLMDANQKSIVVEKIIVQ